MAEAILEVAGLMKNFGALQVTYDLHLAVLRGEIHALIGPNGAGKTTLISQLSGVLPSDAGSIRFDGADITRVPSHRRPHLGLARSYQITSILLNFTALDNVAMAVQAHDGHSFRFWKRARTDRRLSQPALAALRQVGLGQRADVRASELAHGEQRLLELAMALAMQPSLLLLDEPMAGMGVEESARVIEIFQALRGNLTMLLVEHDMDAVFALADRVTVLVYGQAIATGTPGEIRANEEVRKAYLGDPT